jgi:hypothetical protein
MSDIRSNTNFQTFGFRDRYQERGRWTCRQQGRQIPEALQISRLASLEIDTEREERNKHVSEVVESGAVGKCMWWRQVVVGTPLEI